MRTTTGTPAEAENRQIPFFTVQRVSKRKRLVFDPMAVGHWMREILSDPNCSELIRGMSAVITADLNRRPGESDQEYMLRQDAKICLLNLWTTLLGGVKLHGHEGGKAS